MHWIVRWESAISQQLLTKEERKAGFFFEFLVEGLLRGDSQARAEYYNKILQIGGITPNQIRAKENMNPVDGGDQSFVMLNLVPLDKVEEVIDKQLEPEPEPVIVEKEPEEEEIKTFFHEKAVSFAEKRSIQLRDKIAKQYKPLILDAATNVVNREAQAIKSNISKREKRATTESIDEFLTGFYALFGDYIHKKMGPVIRSYLLAVINATTNEIGADDINLDVEIKEYIDKYAERHTQSSLKQMLALLEGAASDLEARADEWREKRPEKIAVEETVRASGAAFSWVAFGAGMSMVWKIRGAKTCPFCKSLAGKRVSSGGSFVKAGDEIDPKDGNGPMRFYGTKKHPPLHQGCDCYVSAI